MAGLARLRAFACRAPIVLLAGTLLAAGCRQDMHDQPKYTTYAPSSFFANGASARPPVPNSVARGSLQGDALLDSGMENGAMAARFPFAVTADLLGRGRSRFDAFCSPCHDRTGSGNGMVVQRGYKRPTSFHEPRLRDSAPGYFFQAITKGFGVMPSYATQIPDVKDRWAVVAYIRALQLSQNATLADVPAAARAELQREAQR
ncbi:cytochrome c [Candidatus Binatia bacterium]|nr:cytochrome c [Candidatus Binatia bacterium]